MHAFHPVIERWFERRFGKPTDAQEKGWPEIQRGQDTLIAAPTGSGKTLAAFLTCIDHLLRESIQGTLSDKTHVVYISPLKALSNDVRRNLETPLEEIRQQAAEDGLFYPPIRALVRTGDTPASERQQMVRKPPHILVTTPESLYLLLTSVKAREMLRSVKTVIVDEIHALARDKRGSHLTLSLERLDALCRSRPVRIGLSATQRPMSTIASFLVGAPREESGHHPPTAPAAVNTTPTSHCSIIDVGHVRDLDLDVLVPPEELSAVCSHDQWDQIYKQLVELIQSHRSTLIFVNTRRLAERIAHRLSELLGEQAVASHHGSLSKEIRQSAEQRLKDGQLKVLVATGSLEMGIDVGYIDLVCQIGSTRSIAAFLQRVGRSGHSLRATPKGRIFPLTRDELIECLAMLRGVRAGRLDSIEIPQAPLDILAQQIVATVSMDPMDENALYEMCRRAYPFRELTREQFDSIITLLCRGVSASATAGAYLHRDAIQKQLRPRRHARIVATTSGGAIPEVTDFRVVTADDGTFIGSVNEDFALESIAGDIFLLGNSSWQIHRVQGGVVYVHDAKGAPATIPFWLGEALGRTVELSSEISDLRHELEQRVQDPPTAIEWLKGEAGVGQWPAEQAVQYVATQQAAVGFVPTTNRILFERFFDETGGMQVVIHAPLGSRINRAWGLALRKRFCRSFDFELQAAADENALLLSLGPQHSFALDALFRMLNEKNARPLLTQALLAAPMFQTRWRWNATRALAVPRMRGGKKVPPHMQRFQADDLLAAAFPQQVGCNENHAGDVEVPDHPLVAQTVHDCLNEALDVRRWEEMFRDVARGTIVFESRDTREPSPFCHGILNANPYAFLDDAPLEERRVRAISTRRGLSPEAMRDLGRLDQAAVITVVRDAWPVVRDADELYDTLTSLVVLPEIEGEPWKKWFDDLARQGRGVCIDAGNGRVHWAAVEQVPLVMSALASATLLTASPLAESLPKHEEAAEARVAMARGRMQIRGPTTAAQLASELGMTDSQAFAALEALEGDGSVLRGNFQDKIIPLTSLRNAGAEPKNGITDPAANGSDDAQCETVSAAEVQWCDRRLLARIHRLTLDGLRAQIEAVSVSDFIRFLCKRHRLYPDLKWRGRDGVLSALLQLQGLELPLGAWEKRLLATRVAEYDPRWLDELAMNGQVTWGRLQAPRREEDSLSYSPLHRMVPISIVLRQDLPWLLPPDRKSAEHAARSAARQVLEALQQQGAMFFAELEGVTKLLRSELANALYELASLGLVTSDAFGSIRALASKDSSRRIRGNIRQQLGLESTPAPSIAPAPISMILPRSTSTASGRWALFPGPRIEVEESARVERWAWQLLNRWGVVFKDLMERESLAPPWHQLVRAFRKLELRGQIRGGRFVAQVAGEQYALNEAVEQLRQVRDEPKSEQWFAISGADPLNLTGILTQGKRVPSSHLSSLCIRDGEFIAAQQAGEVRFDTECNAETASAIRRALRQTG